MRTASTAAKPCPSRFIWNSTDHRTKEITMGVFPTYNDDGLLTVELVKILDKRLQKRGNSSTVVVLVKWANSTIDDCNDPNPLRDRPKRHKSWSHINA
ncbi:hypothetical protein Tco_1027339 [Tanacetum coccineum]